MSNPKKPPDDTTGDANGGKLGRPWLAIGMSRSSWYRAGKPTTKPERLTQKDIAKITGWSLRTTQRDLAKQREEEREKRVARVHEYMAQGHSQDEACKLTAAELQAAGIEKLISEGRLVRFVQASQKAAKWREGETP